MMGYFMDWRWQNEEVDACHCTFVLFSNEILFASVSFSRLEIHEGRTVAFHDHSLP